MTITIGLRSQIGIPSDIFSDGNVSMRWGFIIEFQKATLMVCPELSTTSSGRNGGLLQIRRKLRANRWQEDGGVVGKQDL